MNRKRFLYVLAGALMATVLSFGASQGDEHKTGDPGDSHYHHAHDKPGDHQHNCRATGKTDAKTRKQTLECQDHDGNWGAPKKELN